MLLFRKYTKHGELASGSKNFHLFFSADRAFWRKEDAVPGYLRQHFTDSSIYCNDRMEESPCFVLSHWCWASSPARAAAIAILNSTAAADADGNADFNT
jgi:hypothetical protein